MKKRAYIDLLIILVGLLTIREAPKKEIESQQKVSLGDTMISRFTRNQVVIENDTQKNRLLHLKSKLYAQPDCYRSLVVKENIVRSV